MSGERPGSACAEVRRLLLEGPQSADDGATEARAAAHLGRCPDCQRARDRLQALRADVERAATPLDDMRRARVLGPAGLGAGRPGRRRGRGRRGRGLRSGRRVRSRGVALGAGRGVRRFRGGGAGVVAGHPPAPRADLPWPAGPRSRNPRQIRRRSHPRRLHPSSWRCCSLTGQRTRGGTRGGPGAGRSPAAARGQAAAAAPRHTRHRDADRARPAARDPERGRPAGGEPRPGHAGGGLRSPGRRPAAGPVPRGAHPGRRHAVLGEGRPTTSSRIVVARGRVLVTGEGGPVHMLAAGDALSTDRGRPPALDAR